MTDPETPISEQISSVVGVDPEQPAPEPTPEPEPTPTVEPDPGTVSLTEDEYARLHDDANNFRTITGDPQLNSVLAQALRDKAAGKLGVTPAEPHPSQPGGDAVSQENQQLRTEVEQMKQVIQDGARAFQQLQNEMANIRTDRFAERNPSFTEHQAAVAAVLKQNPTLTLDDALTLVEAKAARAGGKTIGGGTATPSTEGGGAGSLPSSGGNSDDAKLEELSRRVNDPKATPSMDAALDDIGRTLGLM